MAAPKKEQGQPINKPLPAPTGGESESAFMDRCMGELSGEFGDEEQRAAVCFRQWRESKGVEKHSSGVMLALEVPVEIAESMAIEKGIHPSELHVTLAYLGKRNTFSDDAILAIKEVAHEAARARAAPISGHFGGIGRFTGVKDAQDAVYASVDAPDLPEFRQDLVASLKKRGVEINREHGFSPHMTLAYVGEDDPMPIATLKRQPVRFDNLIVNAGGETTRFSLGPDQVSKSLYSAIVKAEKRLVTGVVLQPDVVDAQGDIIDAESIEVAAHDFLSSYNLVTQMGLQHRHMAPGIRLVESYVAPVDFDLGDKLVKRGTWLITVKILDDKIWEQVSIGKIKGFSIGGVAKVQRVA